MVKDNLSDIIKFLKNIKTLKNIKVLVGFDGFIDEIIHVVDKRTSFNKFSRINNIKDFGERIVNASGVSANLEFVPLDIKIGGNGPIYANALINQDMTVSYIGAIGNGIVNEVFRNFAKKAEKVYPICEPGHTDALEFEDGKLMLGKTTSLNDITWSCFKDAIGSNEDIANLFDSLSLLGLHNWTMTPHMNDIWGNITNDIFPLMINKKNRSFAFFDLADPAKRTKENILKAVDLIKIFETKFKVILSLNESEVYKISKCLDIDNNLSSDDSLKNTSELIYKTLKISMLLIHKKTEAFAFSDNKYTQVSIPLCKSPLITTGAGDNFNAGFSLGMLSGASLYSSLIMACACAGFYIRSGRSANKEDLCDFLDKWDKGNLN